MIVNIWKGQASTPLFMTHMGFGLGSFIVPLLSAPFVDAKFSDGEIQSGYHSKCKHDTNNLNNLTSEILHPEPYTTANQTIHVLETPVPQYPARFVAVYWIISGFSIVIALIFASFHIHGKVTDVRVPKGSTSNSQQAFRDQISPKSCSPTHPRLALLIIGALVIYFLLAVPSLRPFGKLIFSYARDGPCMSVSQATKLNSAFFISLTVGRFAAFLASMVLHIKYILQV